MAIIKIKGELEIDTERGVVYFHSEETGHSPLRISNLPTPVPDPRAYGEMLDISRVLCREQSLPVSPMVLNWKGE